MYRKIVLFYSPFFTTCTGGVHSSRVSSDGGALLLREADRRPKLLGRLASCFLNGRAALRVNHRVSEMLAQRVYGLALGYEDLCDHQPLRSGPLLEY